MCLLYCDMSNYTCVLRSLNTKRNKRIYLTSYLWTLNFNVFLTIHSWATILRFGKDQSNSKTLCNYDS